MPQCGAKYWRDKRKRVAAYNARRASEPWSSKYDDLVQPEPESS